MHYVPGWDCHGVPIEQRALAEIKADHRELDPMKIRTTGLMDHKKDHQQISLEFLSV